MESKAPTVVGKLKDKLQDVNDDSSTALKTVLGLSSSWFGPAPLPSQIPVPVTWTVSQSTWAELGDDCVARLNVHRPVPSPPDPAHLSLFWVLFPTFPAVENSHHEEPEVRHFGIPMVDTAKGSGHSGLPRGNIFSNEQCHSPDRSWRTSSRVCPLNISL